MVFACLIFPVLVPGILMLASALKSLSTSPQTAPCRLAASFRIRRSHAYQLEAGKGKNRREKLALIAKSVIVRAR